MGSPHDQLQLFALSREILAFVTGGFASKADVEEKKLKLLESLRSDGEYKIEEKDGGSSSSSATLAQYNDPFTPPWKRRNEVSVPVVPRK